MLTLIWLTPNLDWLLLTKRPENIIVRLRQCRRDFHQEELGNSCEIDWLNAWLAGNPPHNIWLGTTVENQRAAESRISILLSVPALIHFLSCEPLLGAIDLSDWLDLCQRNEKYFPRAMHCPDRIGWVIAGGETGPNAPHPDWFRSLRDQCTAAGIPYLFKQWGEWMEAACEGVQHSSTRFTFPDGTHMKRVPKKTAGRILDGQLHDGFPSIQSITSIKSIESIR